jgi:hypothetical protein
MAHAVIVSAAFQLVDAGPKKKSENKTNNKNVNRSGNKTKNGEKEKDKNGKTQREPPICLFPPCKSLGKRHWLSDCPFSTDEEKAEARKQSAAEKAKTGPSKSTRSQSSEKPGNSKSDAISKKTTGRQACLRSP